MKYFYAYFNSRRKSIVQRLARGTNKKAINDTRLREYVISYPSEDEQEKVGHIVDDIFINVEHYKEKIEKEYAKLENLI